MFAYVVAVAACTQIQIPETVVAYKAFVPMCQSQAPEGATIKIDWLVDGRPVVDKAFTVGPGQHVLTASVSWVVVNGGDLRAFDNETHRLAFDVAMPKPVELGPVWVLVIGGESSLVDAARRYHKLTQVDRFEADETKYVLFCHKIIKARRIGYPAVIIATGRRPYRVLFAGRLPPTIRGYIKLVRLNGGA